MWSLMPPHLSSGVHMRISFPLFSAPKFQAVLHACEPSTASGPHVSLSPSHSETQTSAAVENLPLIPLFSLLFPPTNRFLRTHLLSILDGFCPPESTRQSQVCVCVVGGRWGTHVRLSPPSESAPQQVRVPSISPTPPAWMWDYEKGEGGWGRSALLL